MNKSLEQQIKDFYAKFGHEVLEIKFDAETVQILVKLNQPIDFLPVNISIEGIKSDV